jgi:hypothetical protein
MARRTIRDRVPVIENTSVAQMQQLSATIVALSSSVASRPCPPVFVFQIKCWDNADVPVHGLVRLLSGK